MSKTDPETLLNLLLHELTEARDDDRSMHAQFPTHVTVGLTLVVAMGALYATTCPKGYCPEGTSLLNIPIWVYGAAPLLPVIFVSYVVLVSTLGTLRSYYVRTIERKIHNLTGQISDQIPIPSWGHLQLEVSGQMHSGRWARLNWLLVYGIILLMMLGICVALAFKIPIIRWRVFALAVDAFLIVIPTVAGIHGAMRGVSLWEHALATLRSRLARTDHQFSQQPRRDERSLGSYLILPRNQEELLKALFIPISFGVGRWLASGVSPFSLEMFWHLLGFLFVFEFLVYQARYLLNDVRDRRVDCNQKLSKRRWRFPCSRIDDPVALKAALVSFLARWVIALLLVACILPVENSMWVWHLGFLVSIFFIALPYEAFRSKCNMAAEARSEGQAKAWTWVVISVVGLGYGLRSLVGLWLAGVDDIAALILITIGASLFGSTLVALTWALESTRAELEDLADAKAHLVLFRRAVSRTASLSNVRVSTTEKVLAGRQSLGVPWFAFAVASTGVLFFFALCLLRIHYSISLMLIVVVVLGITGVAVVTPARAALILTALNLVGLGVVLHCFSVPTAQSAIAAMLVGLPLIAMGIFRTMCFEDIPGLMDKLIKAGAAKRFYLYSWFIKER